MSETYKIRGTKVTTPYPVKLTPGEIRLIFSLERYFAPERILVDVYLPRREFERVGDFAKITPLDTRLTQIDCIVVSELGVLVIESKDFSGWVYGDFAQAKWTQVLDFGREKNTFYNPFLQNEAHLEALKNLLGAEIPLISVVVFGNKTVLKTLKTLPAGHYFCLQSGIHELIARMKSETKICLSDDEMAKFCDLISRGRVVPDARTIATHIDEVGRAKRRL